VVKIADRGAATIRALLEEESASMGKTVEAVGAGLINAEESQGTDSASAGTAIFKLRSYYEDLARRIERIDTSDGRGKRLALSGLKTMVAGLSRFEEGIVGAGSDPAQKALGEAASKLLQGAEQVERVEAEL
jgi:hypothetical protein